MLQNRGLAAVLPLDGEVEDCPVAGLLDELAHRPDDPEGLVGIASVVVGIPGQYRVAILKLVAQTFQDLRLGLLRTIVQERHRDLQVVPHALLAHDAEIHLLFDPSVHDGVELGIRGVDGEAGVFLPVTRLRAPQGVGLSALIGIVCGVLPGFRKGFRHAENQPDLFALAGQQRQLMLQHRAGDK